MPDQHQRRVTMSDVAKRAGVSPALVSYALRDLPGVSASTRTRILSIADKLGYRPNELAARLAGLEDSVIGVFLLDLHNEVFADMYDGMRAVADANRRELVVTVGSRAEGASAQQGLDQLVRSQVRVAIACCLSLPESELLRYENWMRIVSVGRLVSGLDSVAGDDRRGGWLAVEHLRALGHTDIAYLGVPGEWPRREGYSSAMAAAGLNPRIVESADQSVPAVTAAAESLLDSDHPPTAVFTFSDAFAIALLAVARRRGVAVPGQLSVVGCDNASAAAAPGVDLTTIDLRPEYCGQRGVELAMMRARDPTAAPVHEPVEPSLIVRSSTATVRI